MRSIEAARPRVATAVVRAALALVLIAVGTLWPGRAYAGLPPITSYITRAGDQVVVVPNGTYAGGSVVAGHSATSGPYKGWLVLVSQSPQGAVIDLSQGQLTLEAGTS